MISSPKSYFFLFLGLFWPVLALPVGADDPAIKLDTRSRQIVAGVQTMIGKAGSEYLAGRFEDSARSLEKAMNQVEIAARVSSPELYEALLPKMQRITDARIMIELEGVAIAPFQHPPRATADMAKATEEKKPEPGPKPNPFTPEGNGVSFVSQVAPILSSKCGGCHVRGSKGGFSLSSYAVLMKGPSEGVVVFPGDTIGSRLIETIETGDMPRGGGKVAPEELAILKRWINEGAKFDGADPTANLGNLAANAPPAGQPIANVPAEPPMVAAPTGKETVDFASQVAPLLVANCTGCHIDAMQARGGLDMNTLARMFRGGDSGPVVEPGKGEGSLLVRKLRGSEGDRMPAGGRPPLQDTDIALISKWIDEGATVDPSLQEESLGVITQAAWLAAASPTDVSAKRAEIAGQHTTLAGADTERLATHQSDHFALWGDVSPGTLKIVAEQAEAALQRTSMIVPAKDLSGKGAEAESFFNGKATIYVLPRRYDYNEFAKMIEQRSLPPDWEGHWSFNGIEAYVAVVAGANDEEDVIAKRLAAPVASLAVASRALSVPRWFADGMGKVVAASGVKRDRAELARIQSELITAVGSLKSGKEFFAGQLPPERADRLAAAVCDSFLTREKKRGFDTVMRNLSEGKKFDDAFLAGMGVSPTAYFDAWIAWVK
jgi:hypothetical protein